MSEKGDIGEKTAILVDDKAINKALRNGLSITLSYDFIRTFKPEFAELSDKELKAVLSKMSQEALRDIFAGGIYVMAEETVRETPGVVPIPMDGTGDKGTVAPAEEEKETPEGGDTVIPGPAVVIPGEDKVIPEDDEKKPEGEENPAEEEEKNKRRRIGLGIGLVLLIGALTLGALKSCSRTQGDEPEPPPPEPPAQEEVISEKEEEDKTIIVPISYKFTIHNPTDSTQQEKTLTDLGDQEHESNIRKEGKSTDGKDMWARENEAVERYEQNKANVEKMKELMAIANDDSKTPEERQQALLEMESIAFSLYSSYDESRIEELNEYAHQELAGHPDELTETEGKIADDAVETYRVDMGTQKSNAYSLSYAEYLSRHGYEIVFIETQMQPDGDLDISFTAQRTIKESQKGMQVLSYEDYVKALEEHIEAGKDPLVFAETRAETDRQMFEIGQQAYYQGKTTIDLTKPVKEAKAKIGVEDTGLTISMGDLQKLAAQRNMKPQDVERAVKAMTDAMEKQGREDQSQDGRV